jgi:hypothetical protein
MDQASLEIVGEDAAHQIGRAEWTAKRGAGGRVQKGFDSRFPGALHQADEVDEIFEALLIAAARQDIAESRIW